jgi:hypothetical protein
VYKCVKWLVGKKISVQIVGTIVKYLADLNRLMKSLFTLPIFNISNRFKSYKVFLIVFIRVEYVITK